jgi:uncharacterized membrane-anchored protein
MWPLVRTMCVAAVTALAVEIAPAQESVRPQLDALPWQSAPADADIAGLATIKLTGDLRFLDAHGTRRFLELTGNPPRDGNYTLAPSDYRWFAIFRYDDAGHVDDSERIDPDALLATLQEGSRRGSEERRRLGLEVLTLEGWSVAPHYDLATKRLEWGTRLRGEDNSLSVNYSIRLLGRTGVMNAMLVSDPDALETDLRDFRSALAGFAFTAGNRYAEFRQGDRTAEYGLAALIVGGAAAAAAKSGAAKGLLKMIAIGAVAFGGAIMAFFRKLFRRT